MRSALRAERGECERGGHPGGHCGEAASTGTPGRSQARGSQTQAGQGLVPVRSPPPRLPAWFCLGGNPGRHATESHAGWLPSSTPHLAQSLQCGTFGALIRSPPSPRLPSTSPRLHPAQSFFQPVGARSFQVTSKRRRKELLSRYKASCPYRGLYQLLIMIWTPAIHFYPAPPSAKTRREQDRHMRPFPESEADITLLMPSILGELGW